MNPTAPTPNPSDPALLVVDAVARDPQVPTRLAARLRFGGHRLRVVLDFAQRELGLIEHVELPWLLGMHPPSQHAVVSLLERIDAGEAIPLPCDLSEQVRTAEPPFPLRTLTTPERERLEAAAAQVPLEVLSIRRSGTAPTRISARLRLAGQTVDLEAELYVEAGAVPLLRWLAGPDPASMGEAQRYAIQQALATPADGMASR